MCVYVCIYVWIQIFIHDFGLWFEWFDKTFNSFWWGELLISFWPLRSDVAKSANNGNSVFEIMEHPIWIFPKTFSLYRQSEVVGFLGRKIQWFRIYGGKSFKSWHLTVKNDYWTYLDILLRNTNFTIHLYGVKLFHKHFVLMFFHGACELPFFYLQNRYAARLLWEKAFRMLKKMSWH